MSEGLKAIPKTYDLQHVYNIDLCSEKRYNDIGVGFAERT